MRAQLPEDCKGIEFEFVKNVSGALMRPTLASGVRVNGNILLKSIASTGAVYVRLLVEDDLEEDFKEVWMSSCLRQIKRLM